MPDFRIIIDIKDVAKGDATSLAQEIFDKHGPELDAHLGDFTVRVMAIRSGAQFEIDWGPDA